MNLYVVKVRKGHDYWVVAEDPTRAYGLVRGFLERRDYYFAKDRELHTVTLIAKEGDYRDGGDLLLVSSGVRGRSAVAGSKEMGRSIAAHHLENALEEDHCERT